MKILAILACLLFTASAYAGGCIQNENGQTICTNTNQSSGRAYYNPNTGRGGAAYTNPNGVTRAYGNQGGRAVKGPQGYGAVQGRGGTTCARTRRGSGCSR